MLLICPETVNPVAAGAVPPAGWASTVSEPLRFSGAEMACRPESIQMSAVLLRVSVNVPEPEAIV